MAAGTTRVFDSSGAWLAYSALTSVTLCLIRAVRSGCVPSQPESTMPTVTPLPVKPFLRSSVAAWGVDDITFDDAVSSYDSVSFG